MGRDRGDYTIMKIDFEFETQYGRFRDSLTLPENIVYGEDAIQAMKEQRRDRWIEFVKNPPQTDPAVEDTGNG